MSRFFVLLLLLGPTLGCLPQEREAVVVDGDGDGVPDGEDCAPNDADRAPGLAEECDGEDTDCDSEVPTSEQDRDDDWLAPCEGDCDDDDPTRRPGRTELCNGVDDDCDDVTPVDEFTDQDRDDFVACEDCDDEDWRVRPGAPEICDGKDSDCDGDLPPDEVDEDGDGHPACEDCDDEDASRHPGAVELCDGVDSDCRVTWDVPEADSDEDGWFNCEDCAPLDAAIHPGADEACNGLDDDCDGAAFPGEQDLDFDGLAPCEGDCDDSNWQTAPGAPERCDGLDNDCDGALPADEADADADGYMACGYYSVDCDDLDPGRYPGAPELCDGVLQDCSATLAVDELDLDLDGLLPCAGDDDLLSPQPVLTCDGAAPPPGFPPAPGPGDALAALEYAVAHAVATTSELEALIASITAGLDVVRGSPGTVEASGEAAGWTMLPPTLTSCWSGTVVWTPTEEHDFALSDGTGGPGAPTLTGWYDAIAGDDWASMACMAPVGTAQLQVLQADCALASDAAGTPSAWFAGMAGRNQEYIGNPWLNQAWYDIPEAWDLDFTVGLQAAAPPLLPAGLSTVSTTGSVFTDGVGGYTSNWMPTTFVTITGSRAGTATLHPDTPWELSWSTSRDGTCDSEPAGTATASVHPFPDAAATSTATVVFDGDATCDGCGPVTLDGDVIGDWCLGVGLVPL